MEGPQQPIEVELVSHEAERRPDASSHAAADTETPGPIAANPRWVHTEAGRLTIVGVAAAVIALSIGWAWGRTSGSGGDSGPVAAATTLGVSRTTSDTIAPVESTRPTTSDSSPVVAPTVNAANSGPEAKADPEVEPEPEPEVEPEPEGKVPIDVDETLAGLPLEIVATLSTGHLVTLDLAAGTLDRRSVERPPFGPGGIRAGAEWVLLPSWDDELAWTLVTAGQVGEAQLGSAHRVLDVVGGDTFWQLDDELMAGRPGMAVELGFDGVPTGAMLQVPVRPMWADPAGGVLVPTVGGVYRVTADGVSRLSLGSLLAVDTAHAVAHECDDRLNCGPQLIDRRSAERTAVIPSDVLGPAPRFERPWWPVPTSMLSADAGAMITIWSDGGAGGRQVLGVLDLVSGQFDELTAARDHTSIGWSPDGEFVFFADGGRLLAFVRDSREIVAVAEDLFAVEAFAVRSTPP